MPSNKIHYDEVIKNAIDVAVLKIDPELILGIIYTPGSIESHVRVELMFGAIRVNRSVIISNVDSENNFAVRLTESLVEPEFTIRSKICTLYERTSPVSIYRDIIAFLTQQPKENSLEELLAIVLKANTINQQWLVNSGFTIVPYSLDYGRPGKWRYKIVDTLNAVTHADYLDPNVADGHTYAMFLNAIKQAYGKGEVEGAIRAVEQLALNQFQVALGKFMPHNLPEPIQEFISRKTLGH